MNLRILRKSKFLTDFKVWTNLRKSAENLECNKKNKENKNTKGTPKGDAF